MLKLIIEDDEGRKTVVPFVRDEITIGRQEGNTIRLTERNVSRRHARLVRLNGHVVVEDLGSYNGTRINGERIAGQSPLKEGDLIQIGDYDLALQAEGVASVSGPITTKVPSALRKTEPALEPMGSQEAEEEEEEQDDASDAPGSQEEEDGDEHDHTPPSSAEVRRHSTSIIRLDQVEADRPRKVVDVPAEDAPRLLVLTPDELKGQEFACIRTELRIGRTDDNDIALDHRSLSRTHAKLVREESGEWRVIDMQSANGLTVNGEGYAQATLGSGDIIELGHVKLRFLHAGDAADDLPAGEGGSRSKLPLVAGLFALVCAVAVGFFIFFRPQLPGTPVTPVTPVAQPGPDTAPPAVDPQPSPGTAPASAAAQPPPEAPSVPSGPTPEQREALAQKAFEARDLDRAEDYLNSVPKDAQGRRPANVEKLLDSVHAEQMVQKQLAKAETALSEGKLAEAESVLASISGTKVFAADHSKLLGRVADEKKKKATAPVVTPTAAANPSPPSEPNVVVPAGASETAEDPRVTQALAEGKKLRSKQPTQAIRRLQECLDLAPTNFECHLYLGSAYAYAEKSEEGIPHFRRFLELAPPDHPKRSDVEKLLEGYKPRPK